MAINLQQVDTRQRFINQGKERMDQQFIDNTAVRCFKSEKNQEGQRMQGERLEEVELEICQMNDQEVQSLRIDELLLNHRISPEQSKLRTLLFNQLIKVGHHTFKLRIKTTELTMIVFDYFCYISAQYSLKTKSKNKRSTNKTYPQILCLSNIDQGKLALSACLFFCAKYNEIYAPNINDICYFADDKFHKAQILAKEIQILKAIDVTLELSTISKWYQMIFDLPLPLMALQFYASETIFHTEDFAIAFAYAILKEKNPQSISQASSFIKFKQIYEQVDTYKEKIYQNDKSKTSN